MVLRAAWYCTDWPGLDKGVRSRSMLWSFSPSFYHSHGLASLTLKPSKRNTTETIFFCTNTSLLFLFCCALSLYCSDSFGTTTIQFYFPGKTIILLTEFYSRVKTWLKTSSTFSRKNVNSFRTVKCFPCLEGVFIDFSCYIKGSREIMPFNI